MKVLKSGIEIDSSDLKKIKGGACACGCGIGVSANSMSSYSVSGGLCACYCSIYDPDGLEGQASAATKWL